MLGCGLAPPGSSTPQYSGNGVLHAPTLPPGSPCIVTQELPPGVDDTAPSRTYISLTPAVSGDPESNLSATATITSPLPIGSPTGPTTVAVPPLHVKTAAELNAEAAVEAQAIAQQLNDYQQQQLDDAASVHAFQDASPALAALLDSASYTASDFYMPAAPPLPGAQAASEDATTWTFSELVYVHSGHVVHDQIGTDPSGNPTYGPEYCSELAVLGTDGPYLQSQVTTTVSTVVAQVTQVADALWHSFRRGTIVTEPADGSPTYVGMPTCAGLDTGLPTGSGTPNPFTLALPLSLRGTAGSLPVTVSARIAVSIVADGVQWNFADSSGDTVVSGQGSADPAPPHGTPSYDPATGTWPNVAALCTVYHQYRGLSAAPGVLITATEHFHIDVTGAYSTGSAAPVTFEYSYEPADSPVRWVSGPYPVYQIEAVPFAPSS